MFTPVAVGEKVSPKQVYELYNGGATPVKFNFDLAPLELLRQVKYTLISKVKCIRIYQLQILQFSEKIISLLTWNKYILSL